MKRILMIFLMLAITFTMIGCDNETKNKKIETEIFNTTLNDEDLNKMMENVKYNFDEVLLKNNVSLEDIVRIDYQTRMYSSILIVYEEKDTINSIVKLFNGSYIETFEDDMFMKAKLSELTFAQIVFKNADIMTVYSKVEKEENKISFKHYIEFNEKFYESI